MIKHAVNSIDIRNQVQTKDDLFMDAVAHILKYDMRVLRLYRGKSKFSTYLYTVCRRHVMAQATRENALSSKMSEMPLESIAGEMPDVMNESDGRAILALRYAISVCDENTQLFIKAMFYDKRPCNEIMRLFGWNSENSVYSKKNKTIAKLKKQMRRNLLAEITANDG
jgi:RNA polymerase sigma factor (sigma-70 family)